MLIAVVVIVAVLAFLMELGAIILKMTGLDIDKARFQALSALTGTGFTTREAEALMHHPLRRKVVMTLMIIGNAGLVSILITIVSTSRKGLSFVQLSIALLLLALLIRVITDRWVIRALDKRIEKTLEKRQLLIRKKTVEEVLRLGTSYGIAEVWIKDDSDLLGLTLGQAELTERNILVLAIEREGQFIHMPRSYDRIEEGDTLLVYGDLESLRQLSKRSNAINKEG